MIKQVVFILLFLLPYCSFASYQCGNSAVIHEGDSYSSVISKCGTPVGQGANSITYNPGYGKFYEILIFQDDKFVQVKTGSRVTQSESESSTSESEDASGCCSHNGGIAGCKDGRRLCRNGKLSPSCKC